MSTESSPPTLSGELYHLPFQAGRLEDHAAPIFADLAAAHSIDNVLVVKRFPTGIDVISEALAEGTEGVERPTIVGLSAHANRVLTDLRDPPALVNHSERPLLMNTFLRDRDWTHPYLQRGTTHDSFKHDVSRFVSEATWQGGQIESDDDVLTELADTVGAFHDWLSEADLLDPARSLRYATDELADRETRARVQSEFDAVLALEFEEFTAIDRAYLARLTSELPLVCIAETGSAIQRTWNEPRTIDEHVPGLQQVGRLGPKADAAVTSQPAAIASYLATGAGGEEPTTADGEVNVIETETFSDEIAAIADEIERLRRTEGIAYDDMVVVLRDSNAPIPETLRGLHAAGIPVSSATVGGLEHDPAARELYALASVCLQRPDSALTEEYSDSEHPGWKADRARATLAARVEGVVDEIEPLLETIITRSETDGIGDAVDHWVIATDLKHRISTDEGTLDAKTQFEHIRRLRELIQAIDESPLLASDWQTVCDGIEQEMQRAASDKIATDLDVPEGGVLVDAVRVVKNEHRNTVFLVDVIDREYPAAPQFNSLFPTPHLETLEGYPAFTTPTAADVTATFEMADQPNRPLHGYYAALSRRLLAVGARCASDQLYLCQFQVDATGTGNRQQPSRFLSELEDVFGEFDRVDHDGIFSHGEAVRFALTRVDDALDRVRRAGLLTEPIDLADLEAEFEAVQRILEADPPADLPPAIEARLDFAQGGVRRD